MTKKEEMIELGKAIHKIRPSYIWITCDQDGTICAFEDEPFATTTVDSGGWYCPTGSYQNMFEETEVVKIPNWYELKINIKDYVK